MKSIVNIWSSKKLTLLGKITVLKIPKLVYKAFNLHAVLPDSIANKINQILCKVIWGSKWEKIGPSQLCRDIEEGGAKMIDMSRLIYICFTI